MLYMLEKTLLAIDFANVLHKAIFELDKLFYNQYIFLLLQYFGKYYSKTNIAKSY